MANTNRFLGLARGPIDHNASAVINQIANDAIIMGSVVKLHFPIPEAELLPRVQLTTTNGSRAYGIVVGGDNDGVYGDGSTGTDLNKATLGTGDAVVVVTQGRCLARVEADGANVPVESKLTPSDTEPGLLKLAGATDEVIAIALQQVTDGDTDIVAVDVQREGIF